MSVKPVDNWKSALKMRSVQLSIVIIFLEAMQASMVDMQEEYAIYVRPFLLVMLPVARLMKQTNLE